MRDITNISEGVFVFREKFISSVEMEVINSSKTSVSVYETSRCKVPQDTNHRFLKSDSCAHHRRKLWGDGGRGPGGGANAAPILLQLRYTF
jgi:hypothetical protein